MPTLSRSEQFTELLSLHQSQSVGYIFARMQDLEDTQDIFQQTSLVLWRKFDHFDGVNFAGWACRTQLEAMNYLCEAAEPARFQRGIAGRADTRCQPVERCALARCELVASAWPNWPAPIGSWSDLCYGRDRAP